MEESAAKRVFISYSHEDARFVEKLTADLVTEGISVWIDRTGLAPGTPNWDQAIREAIRAARAVLLVDSPSAFQAASRLSGFFHVFLGHVLDAGGVYHDAQGEVRIVASDTVVPARYRYQFVLSTDTPTRDGKTILVETASNQAAPGWL